MTLHATRTPLLLALCFALCCTLAGCGSLAPSANDPENEPKEVTYAAALPIPPMLVPTHGGDFALFYNDSDQAEVPVRVKAGEPVGFLRDDEGRLRATAGPFQMNVPLDVPKATWRRLNDRED